MILFSSFLWNLSVLRTIFYSFKTGAYKAGLFPSVELIKFLIRRVFEDFARICTNFTGTEESWIKVFSAVSLLFSCLLNFAVTTGKDSLWESWGSQCTCLVMSTVTEPDYSDYSGLYSEVEPWTVTRLTFMEGWKSQGRPPKPHFPQEYGGALCCTGTWQWHR